MAQHSESAYQQFVCSCQQVNLYRHQITDHLKIKATHYIRKIDSQLLKNLKNSILNRMENIKKTQIHIQASSNQLIHAITQNTSVVLQKLSNIINLYRHLILNPPKVNNIKNFEVINTFKFNTPLFDAVTQHFGQQSLAERPTIGMIAKNIKAHAIDIKRNYIGSMYCMAVFNDEKRVVTGGFDGAIRIWNLETRSQIWFILKHKGQIYSLALGNTEDFILTGSNDTSVRLWNVKLKLQVHKFLGHNLGVYSVLFSKDQSTGFSGSWDKTIRSWNLKLLTPQMTISFQTPVYQICLIRQEKIIVASQNNGLVSFFNFKDNNHSNTPSHHNQIITSICFTANEEQFITGSQDGIVEVWLMNGLKRQFFQKKHTRQISCIKISTCSKIFATGSHDETVIVWEFTNLHTTKSIENGQDVSSLYFLKNSSSLLICCASKINCYSLTTFIKQEKITTKQLNSIAISSDLKYAAYGLFSVFLIDIQNKTKNTKSSGIKKEIFCLKFSPDSALVAVGCDDGEITILSIPNLVQLRTLYTKLSKIMCLSFSKSSELIGFGDGSSAKVLLIKTKEMLYENKGKSVISVCFCSNDEKFIYSVFNTICVLTKNFSILTKIGFRANILELIVNEDSSYVLVTHFSNRFSILKAESLEKICEEESRKVVKEWCTRRQEILFRTHLCLLFSLV